MNKDEGRKPPPPAPSLLRVWAGSPEWGGVGSTEAVAAPRLPAPSHPRADASPPRHKIGYRARKQRHAPRRAAHRRTALGATEDVCLYGATGEYDKRRAGARRKQYKGGGKKKTG